MSVNNRNINRQGPMGQKVLQGAMIQPTPTRPQGWRGRWMRRFGMDTAVPLTKGERTIPSWIPGRSVAFFFIALFACWLAWGYVPTMDLVIVSVISILVFFLGGSAMSKAWSNNSEKQFLRNVFVVGLAVRLIWLLYCWFFFNMDHYGAEYGERADVAWYMPFAKDLTLWITNQTDMTLSEVIKINCSAPDDVGYPMWLAIGYVIWGQLSDAFIPMVIKCIVGAYCAVSIYHVAQRHFGEGVARMAAIFVAINPNMIYWCGNMFKESEMVFLVCLAVDNFDRVLTSGKKFTFKSLLPGTLAAMALMFFRAPLGIVMFLAVFAHIVMASQRVMSMGKKIIAGVLVGLVLAVSMGDRIIEQSKHLVESAQSDSQAKNMEWRSTRKDGGNSFAKYATAAVFAPLIFTIPFPTFNVAEEGQYLQIQLSGGSYIKNIFSFFVIMVMFMMLISGEWRQHVFIIGYTVGYLITLVMSSFAHSGRFHMPIWPMLMLFAAYGIQVAKTNKKLRRWFPIVLVLEVFICLAWNWFKLKGRGMI